MNNLKGTIKRPASATEPIIRIVGDAENHIIEDEIKEFPIIPTGWDEILHCMFAECIDLPDNNEGAPTE